MTMDRILKNSSTIHLWPKCGLDLSFFLLCECVNLLTLSYFLPQQGQRTCVWGGLKAFEMCSEQMHKPTDGIKLGLTFLILFSLGFASLYGMNTNDVSHECKKQIISQMKMVRVSHVEPSSVISARNKEEKRRAIFLLLSIPSVLLQKSINYTLKPLYVFWVKKMELLKSSQESDI